MTIVSVIAGDVCDAKERYIAHQCNCVTQQAKGTAGQLFARFKDENVYARRTYLQADEPGTIKCTGRLIHLFAQWGPGKPKAWVDAYRNRKRFAEWVHDDDSKAERQRWFQSCLDAVVAMVGADEVEALPVAFPMGIGCNMAGGDWSTYKSMLEQSKLQCVLYDKNKKKPQEEDEEREHERPSKRMRQSLLVTTQE